MRRYLIPLILISILVYLNSFGNDFVWDDLNNIVNNEQLEKRVDLTEVFLKTLPNPPLQFYRPIPFLSITVDHLLWGRNPFGYHLTNFLLHLFNVILIFFITARLTNSHLTSFTCALLFAVHPIQTEAITYISGRSDPLCAFFLFSSFLFYLKSLNTIRFRRLAYSGGALLLFLFGLLSKEIAIVFPFIIFAYDSLYLNRPFKVRLRKNIPFFIVMAAFLVFRYIALNNSDVELSLDRVSLVPKILLYYIRFLVLPINLHMQHNLRESPILINMPFILSALIFAGFIFIGLRVAKKRFMKFGLISFFIGLLPFLGIIRLNADIAEHWLYLTSFGFFLFVSGIFAQVKPLNRKISLSILILFFSLLTLQRNAVWRDDISIYQDALKYRPDDHKLHYNLGNAYLRRGLLNEAANEYRLALEINPSYVYALNNLGLIFERRNEPEQAYQFYKKATTLDPNLSVARNNFLNLKFIGYAFADEAVYFDHSLYADVLKKYVKDRNVDYKALKKDPSKLTAYLEKVSEVDAQTLISMSEKERIAFYLNVYNAVTLKVIIENYPVKSIKDIPGVWDRIKSKVAGKELSLNQIEHQILRKEFKEPRIHFALVCASKSCPGLSTEPFYGQALDEQLDRETRKFINDKTKVRLDRSNRVLYISSIFKWFNEDFGDVIKFISKYLSEDNVEFIAEKKPKIRYLNYDWSLNEKL